MKRIVFSRHAKRRMKLYQISERNIDDIISENIPLGKSSIIKNIDGFKYPIKVVFDHKKDDVIIITAYPLKKGKK